VDDLRRLGIDGKDQLFWDGRRIEIRRPLVLTRFQKFITGIVTVCAVLGALGGLATGFNNASVFLCARKIQWLTCPVQQAPSPFPPPATSAQPASPTPRK
jgi:hypothetical protein